MGHYIPEELVETVRFRTDIIEVISEYVLLKKRGRNYVGLCPFHSETSPSFTVAPDKQIFHCFGCGVGGNVFRFLMLKENLTFPEAVRWLAERAGVSMPQNFAADSRQLREKERAFQANEMVMNLYCSILNSNEGKVAKRYLAGRGITPEMQKRFQLGFAPLRRDFLLKHLGNRGYRPDELVKLGLIIKSKRNSTRYLDRFRNRVIFPICDVRGRVIGFGGRVLDERQPKYLNSPETKVFNKSKVLYGLHQAGQAIRDSGYAVLVEGYLDVITAHQYGFKNVVAPLGTSLTREQGRQLRRYASEVVIAFDADAAGMAAAVRGLDILQSLGCRVRVAGIPDGKDPDDFIRKRGKAAWQDLIESAPSLIEFKLKHAAKNRRLDSITVKTEVLEAVLPNLAAIKNIVEREESLKRVASYLNLSWEAVSGELRRFVDKGRKKWPISDKIVNNKHNIEQDAREKAERGLLKIVLESPGFIRQVQEELKGDFFRRPGYQNIYDSFLNSDDFQLSKLFEQVKEEEQSLLSGLLAEEKPEGNPHRLLEDYIHIIKRGMKRERREKILQEINRAEKAGDQELVVKLLHKLKHIDAG